jgi:hypothetical protein
LHGRSRGQVCLRCLSFSWLHFSSNNTTCRPSEPRRSKVCAGPRECCRKPFWFEC